MGWTAVRKLREVAANVRACLAVEILCAAQGIDLRLDIAPPGAATAAATAAAHAIARAHVPRMDVDREVAGQIAALNALLPEICASAAEQCGGLR
jgi:histidine ammonia-lyase